MAKNKNKKPTSIYPMVILAVALVIVGVFVYLWIKTYSPTSEASTINTPSPNYIDYTGTMHFNDREDTLVLGTLKSYLHEVEYEGDPIIKAENEVKEIKALIWQAKNIIAAVGGETVAPIFEEELIDDELNNDYVTPIDDFVVRDSTDDDINIPINADDDYSLGNDESSLSSPNLIPDFESVEDATPVKDEPKSLIGRATNSAKNLISNTTNSIANFFKNTWSKITGKPYISGYTINRFAQSREVEIKIKGNNFNPNRDKNDTTAAPEPGSSINIVYTDGNTTTLSDQQFFGTNTELTGYTEDYDKTVAKIVFASQERGLYSKSMPTTKQTAPVTGGEPVAESIQPKASLSSFKAENLSIGGAKIVISGNNLKVGTAKNMAPERGSRLTIFFGNFANRELNDTEFLVANDSIVAYSTERFEKVTQVYFESPTLGLKSTSTGTTITQPPVNQPKITGYKIDNYDIYDQLVISGENLLISSNRSDEDEQVVIMYRDMSNNTYKSNQFYGSKEKIYIIGDIDEFKNTNTIYFESKTRGIGSTSNQISFVNVLNAVVGKVFAATLENEDTTFRIKAENRRQAYDNLRDEIDDVLAQLETYGDELNAYVIPSQPTGNSSDRESSATSTSGLSIRGGVNGTGASGDVASLKNQLKSARNNIFHLKLNDPVLKIWDTAAEFQARGTLGFDFDLKYSSDGAVFIELSNSGATTKYLINEIANNKTVLNALGQIGRSAFPGGYDTPAWIREAQKTAKNTGSAGLAPATPALNP